MDHNKKTHHTTPIVSIKIFKTMRLQSKQQASFFFGVTMLALSSVLTVWNLGRGTVHQIWGSHAQKNSRHLGLDSELRRNVQAVLASLQLPTNVSIPDDFLGKIENIWTCSGQQSSRQKLIFVHIFKTAGSSFRALFIDYAKTCHRGISVVTHCSQVNAATMVEHTSPWESHIHGKRCQNKYSRDRWNQIPLHDNADVTGRLLRNTSDIIIGHLPVGVDKYWVEEQRRVQYVAFFRDPVAKYVSGRLFKNKKKHWDFETAIKEIKSQVIKERQQDRYYLQCDQYMIAPEQKDRTLSLEERVELVRANMLSFNCAVGIVERMSDSLSLIQHVIDGDLEMTEELRQMDTSRRPPSSDNSTVVTMNKSELSTSQLVATLKEDEEFYFLLLEFLKYEFLVYDYALQVHYRQVQTLYQRFGDRYM